MAGKDTSRQNRYVMIGMGAVLIFGAVTALTVPAGEFPPTAYAIFNLVLDAAMTVLLAILLYAERAAPPGGLKTAANVIAVVGVLAGVVQVLIRFTSDHAWWTGHFAPPVFN